MGKKRVSLSEENLIPDDIAVHQKILQESIRAYYRKPPYWLFEEYCNSSKSVVEKDLENRCIEVEPNNAHKPSLTPTTDDSTTDKRNA